MDKIAVQTMGVTERYGMAEGYRKIREWGFDAADANIHTVLGKARILKRDIPDVLARGGNDCMALFRPWGEAAKATGVENAQAHAPYPTWLPFYGRTNKKLIEVLKNTIRGCDLIGCHKLVIHPFYAGPALRIFQKVDLKRNLDYFSRLIPTAREYGVMICLENMIAHGPKKRLLPGACGDPRMAARYVDELNRLAGGKLFGFCFDTGHAYACRIDMEKALVTLGGRVEALHIHDNDGVSDQHLAPGMGTVNWKKLAEGLHKIGYRGAISFETFNMFSRIPPERVDDAMRRLCEWGRALAENVIKKD